MKVKTPKGTGGMGAAYEKILVQCVGDNVL